MHPIEHLYYFSCTALPMFFLQSPFHGKCSSCPAFSNQFHLRLERAVLPHSDVQRAGETRDALIECVW